MLSKSVKETFEAGVNLSKQLKGGDVVCLSGFLGAGKTVFCKGVAYGLGVKTEVLSPTFTIMIEYDVGDLTLYHIDAYRIKNTLEAEETGLIDVLSDKRTICLVEWHENIKDLLGSKQIYHVEIALIDDTAREIKITKP